MFNPSEHIGKDSFDVSPQGTPRGFRSTEPCGNYFNAGVRHVTSRQALVDLDGDPKTMISSDRLRARRALLWLALFFSCAFARVAAAEYHAACVGFYSTCAIREDRSTVWWGLNYGGQLGIGDQDFVDDYIGD